MRQSITFISLLASTAIAQDVVSFFFPGGAEGVSPVATIETANPTTTQMRVACPTDVDASDCGWGMGVEVKIISGTIYQGTMSADAYTMSYNCNYNSKAVEMTCTGDMTGEDTQTATLSGSDVSFVPATVVEGQKILKAAASATAASATASSATTTAASNSASVVSSGMKTSAMTTGSGSSSAVTASRTSGSSASPTSSGSAVPVSTGAAAKFGVEGSALLVLAGAAAIGLW